MMYSHQFLENLKVKALQGICTDYGLKTSGKKMELIERIIEHQGKLEKLRQNWNARMAHGAAKRDEDFERVMQVFQQWTDENGFWPAKLSDSGVSYVNVDINEIRAAFADYDPRTSSLREDTLIPTPSTKLEVFLEMLFNEHDEWVMFDTTEQEREFIYWSESEFSDRWMIEGMKKIYDVPEPQQWCATSYANRD